MIGRLYHKLLPLQEFSNELTDTRRILDLIEVYRWVSLIPPAILLLTRMRTNELLAYDIPLWAAAIIANIVISVFSHEFNRALQQRPEVLFIDLCFMALLTAYSGGWQSPYYLYILNPLIIMAFFFQLRGAFLATTAFLPMYIGAIFIHDRLTVEPINWVVFTTGAIGLYLICGAIGYASTLLFRLRETHSDLIDAHHQMTAMHKLSTSLQTAADIEAMQKELLTVATRDFGLKRAIIGLVNQEDNSITDWLEQKEEKRGELVTHLHHTPELALSLEDWRVVLFLQNGSSEPISTSNLALHSWFKENLEIDNGIISALQIGNTFVGILLVEMTEAHQDEREELLRVIKAISAQAANVIGTTLLRIDRASKSAINDERLRIARDMHDSVSQSLFGLAYGLEGTYQLLPEQPKTAHTELANLMTIAQDIRTDVRQIIFDIWPDELTAERFSADLQRYVNELSQSHSLQVVFDIRGDISQLKPVTRRSLYRICQESLANVVHHANATEVHICLDTTSDWAQLTVQDNGEGFDALQLLENGHAPKHFGLRGMQDRAQSLSGTFDITSHASTGTSVIIGIPK